jgi:hypothetical protein
MPFSTNGLNKMLDGLEAATSMIAFASLHTAYSATGTNELTGGSPAYARKAITWATAGSGSKAANGTLPTFDIPPSTTVAFVGLWSLVTAGTFAGMGANGGATQFAFTCTLASPGVLTAPGSSYTNGDQVVVFPGAGATLPTGITAGQIYTVAGVSGTTFNLGANTSSVGAGIVQKITTETFNAQGTFTLSADTLTVV